MEESRDGIVEDRWKVEGRLMKVEWVEDGWGRWVEKSKGGRVEGGWPMESGLKVED